jgi:hypothetical protein
MEHKRIYREYGIKSLIGGIVKFTLVNMLIFILMYNEFSIAANVGIFFTVENVFIVTLIASRNYENIQYLKEENDRLKKEIKRINNILKKR